VAISDGKIHVGRNRVRSVGKVDKVGTHAVHVGPQRRKALPFPRRNVDEDKSYPGLTALPRRMAFWVMMCNQPGSTRREITPES
jgi:hypothetical protein